jgi:hypothetical protein
VVDNGITEILVDPPSRSFAWSIDQFVSLQGQNSRGNSKTYSLNAGVHNRPYTGLVIFDNIDRLDDDEIDGIIKLSVSRKRRSICRGKTTFPTTGP